MTMPSRSQSPDSDGESVTCLRELKAQLEVETKVAAMKKAQKEQEQREQRERYQYAIRKDTLKPVRNGLCADSV